MRAFAKFIAIPISLAACSPVSSPAPQATPFDPILGSWQSTIDPKAAITFTSSDAGYEMVSTYDGETVERETARFQQSCDGITVDTPDGLLAVGDEISPLCYSVIVEEPRLYLTYLPRGNTLNYQRVGK